MYMYYSVINCIENFTSNVTNYNILLNALSPPPQQTNKQTKTRKNGGKINRMIVGAKRKFLNN